MGDILWKAALLWVMALSFSSFILMGVDKRRAKNKRWRVPEKTFFILAAMGGAPGAVVGMWVFRHKTRHWYFKYGLPAILLLQFGLALWLWVGLKS